MYRVWAYTKILKYAVYMQSVYIYRSTAVSMYKF